MNDLIFSSDEDDIAENGEPDTAHGFIEDDDDIEEEPLPSQSERVDLLKSVAPLFAEIESRIAELELALVDSFRQSESDFERFAASPHNAALESLMQLRPLNDQPFISAALN